MPIYEYKCGGCQDVFEVLRSRGARDQPANCPSCGSRESSRAMSAFCGRVGTASGGSSSVAGSGGCASCQATSCAGCRG